MATNEGRALKEKELGNAAYKARKFEEALNHYNTAISLNPNEITFYTNKAAVYFEQKKFDDCIEICQKSIEIAREARTDFKLIAKAFSRIANAYMAKKEYDVAITYFDKSLAEHRAPDVVKRKQEAVKLKADIQKKAYLDPEKAETAKKEGNDAFSKGDFPTAIKSYSEAILRNPDDPKLFSNRAAAYTKLAEFKLGLKDCEECIRLDPNFVKGYLRKGRLLLFMQERSKAWSTFQKALELDPNCQEAHEGLRDSTPMNGEADVETVKKRVESDADVQQILADPGMRLILEQIQSDPKAAREHFNNPIVAEKLKKLLECGLIQFR